MSDSLTSAIQSNDVDSLIELVKANPTHDTIDEILLEYETVATSDPANADAYNLTLSSLQDSPNVPQIVQRSGDQGSETKADFDGVFNRALFNTIMGMVNARTKRDVSTSNNLLIASIISGSAIKNKTCFSSDQVGEITMGLHFKEADHTSYMQPHEYEIHAVGALIQVLAAAKRILELNWVYEEELKERVETISKVISNPTGKKIHEAANALAQGGFKDAWASKDIWALLA